MVKPIWEVAPKAVRWFNWRYSLPKVALPSVPVLLGLKQIGRPDRPLALTCSISEDYARLWLYFARKALDARQWDFLVIDSAGEMDPAKFEGAQVVRFLNLYHGVKVDLLLRKMIAAELVFLCDDDMYLLKDLSKMLSYLDDPKTPIVSLFPRDWWKFEIGAQEFLPMGSFALLFKRSFLLRHHLRFQSPKGLNPQYKVTSLGVKPRTGYDTADYMNEQLLLMGYNVTILPDAEYVLGFKGLSDKRMLLMKSGKAYVKQALLEVDHYKEGSVNGANMRSIYGIVKFERLYRYIFQEEPRVVSGFSETEFREILVDNPKIDDAQRVQVQQHFDKLDGIYEKLINYLGGEEL